MQYTFMKKILSYFAATGLGLALMACSSEEADIFDSSAAERLNKISAEYTGRLTDSKGGWVMEYYPYSDNEDLITGVGYLIMNRYNTDGSVFTAMKNKASYNKYWEDTSAWQVITDMGPVLSYNTWNKCYGRFTDPDDIDLTPGSYSNDESGKGFQGDYEFIMVDVPQGGDHIMLKGKKRGIYQRMTRIPEGTDFETYLDDVTGFSKSHFNVSDLWELDMIDNGIHYKINRAGTGCATVYPAEKDSTAYGWHMPFLVTKLNDQYRFRFKDTVMVDKVQMEQEFYFDPADETFRGVKNAENTIKCTPADVFFLTALNGSHKWKTSIAMEKSDDFSAAIDAMVKEMASGSTKYEINGSSDKDKVFVLRQLDDVVQLSFTVKFRRSNRTYTVELTFAYNMVEVPGGITLSYQGASSTGAESMAETFPTISNFLRCFEGTFIVTGKDNSYSLRNMKLTSSTNSNSWITFQYEN